MQFITTIPMFTTKIENKVWHCPIERRGRRFYHNPSPPPSVNVGGSGTGFWQHDSDQHWVGGEGSLFLLKQTKCVNNFFHDCLSEILNFSSEIGFLIITFKLKDLFSQNFAHILVRTLSLFPLIISYKQWHLGSGHSIMKRSICKNVLLQMYFLGNLKPNVWSVTKFRLLMN